MKEDKNKKKKIAVLVGGPSHEHDVSLQSGRKVLEHLPKEKYEGGEILISMTGEWPLPPERLPELYDAAFVAMHGTYGEDGTVQRILEEVKMPYTGSNSSVSALGMNKFLSLRMFKVAGLEVPPTLFFSKSHWLRDRNDVLEKISHHLKKPWVLKPNSSGSSVGVKIADDKTELLTSLDFVFQEFKDVIVQEFIGGKEVTCGVMDYGYPESAFPLVPTEIIPVRRRFFDYTAKYEAEAHEEITPARIPAPYLKEVRRIALAAHKLIGARHFSRTDMIIGKDKKIYVLEINTIPGLTDQSLVPQEAEAYGIPFPKFLDIILESTLREGPRKKSPQRKV